MHKRQGWNVHQSLPILPHAGAEGPTSLLSITATAARQEAGSVLVEGRPSSHPAGPNCFPQSRKMNLFIKLFLRRVHQPQGGLQCWQLAWQAVILGNWKEWVCELGGGQTLIWGRQGGPSRSFQINEQELPSGRWGAKFLTRKYLP